MSIEDLACAIGNYSVEPFDIQMYPRIFRTIQDDVEDLEFRNGVHLLHESHIANDGGFCVDTKLSRPYWENIDSVFLTLKISDGNDHRIGWLRLSDRKVYNLIIENQ